MKRTLTALTLIGLAASTSAVRAETVALTGATVHTLGAAGISEIVLSIDALQTGLVPGTLNLKNRDESLQLPILTQNVRADIGSVMSNSFGFGGNNCSVIFGVASR